MHGAPPERHWVRQTRSNWVWGIILPLGIIIAATLAGGFALLLLALYPLLGARVNGHARRRGMNRRDARNYAIFIVLGKFPQALGQLKYMLARLLGRRPQIIEYKGPAVSAVHV
jgi:hypothetical protein